MSSLSVPVSRRPVADAWISIVLATGLFVALVAVASALVGAVVGAGGTPRAQAVRLVTGSAIGEFTALALLVLFLRRRGRTLRDIGFRGGAPLLGWIAAVLVFGLACAAVLGGALHGRAPIGELSAFRIYTSLTAGVAAGFCEEIVFRGFVMSVLAEAGGGRMQQLVATSLLFGLAHAPWSHLGGGVNPAMLVGAVSNTAILGLLYGVVLLLSRRSLVPAIVAHGLTDMTIEPWLMLSALGG